MKKWKLIACFLLSLAIIAALLVLTRDSTDTKTALDRARYRTAEPNRTDPQELCNWYVVNILYAPEKAYGVSDEWIKKVQSLEQYVQTRNQILPSAGSISSIEFLSSKSFTPIEMIETEDGFKPGQALPPYSEYVYKIGTRRGWLRRDRESHTLRVEISEKEKIHIIQGYGISTDLDEDYEEDSSDEWVPVEADGPVIDFNFADFDVTVRADANGTGVNDVNTIPTAIIK